MQGDSLAFVSRAYIERGEIRGLLQLPSSLESGNRSYRTRGQIWKHRLPLTLPQQLTVPVSMMFELVRFINVAIDGLSSMATPGFFALL